MTANQAPPGSPSSTGYQEAAEQAGPVASPVPAGRTATVRGSRGRHAGPPVAAQAGGVWPQAEFVGWWRGGAAALRGNPLATAGGAVVVLLTALCFIGPLIYHTDQTHVFLAQANLSPRAGHPLGTDGDGSDELGRLLVGGRISLEVGAAAGILAAVLGSLWGAVAGYCGGVVDAVLMRIVDAAISIPAIVLLLLLVSIYRPSTSMLVLVIAGTSWLSTARLVRAEALTVRVREYVQAMRVMGGSGLRAVLRHIAPNALGTIVVNVTFQVANAILVLATLSYLGLGIQFPSVDWGDMISSAEQNGALSNGYWWQVLCPGVAIILVVAALTMLGDGLSDGFSADG